MKSESSPPFDARTAKPMIAHRRQVRLQVYLPLGLFTLLLAALVAWLWVGGVGDASTWADVALVIVLIPAMLVGLVVLAVLLAFAVLLGKLIGIIPEPAHRVQSIFRRAESEISRGTDLALRPLLILSALWTALKAICRGLASLVGIKIKA